MPRSKILVFPFNSVLDFEIKFRPEHEIFRKVIREFVEKELAPKVPEIEKTNTIPVELLRRGADLGFFGLGIPEKYGGQGTSQVSSTIFVEEVSKACPAYTVATLVHELFVVPLLIFGTEEQRARYLPELAKGTKHASHATTEPGAGSDVAGISTTATKQNGHWVINGRKYFISGADKADYFLVLARTGAPPSRTERWKGLTAFIVDRGTPGFRVGEKIPVMGIRGSHPSEVILDSVRVPEVNIVGGFGEGFKVVIEAYDRGRLGVASQALGVLQALFEKCLGYSMQRQTFDRPIIRHQAIQFSLADILTDLNAARLLVYWASVLYDENKPEGPMVASMAKKFCTEAAENAALKAISLHGGMGVAVDGQIERYLRDVEIMKIYEGTNDIQRMIIMRQLVKRAFGIDVS